MEIWFQVMGKSWKSTGQHVQEPCSFILCLSSSGKTKGKKGGKEQLKSVKSNTEEQIPEVCLRGFVGVCLHFSFYPYKSFLLTHASTLVRFFLLAFLFELSKITVLH